MDDVNSLAQGKYTRFYAYLTKMQGELVKVTVAVKHYRKKWFYRPDPDTRAH